MRIAQLLPDLRGGGAERLAVTLGAEFARLGHTPEFWLMRRDGDLVSEAENFGIVADLAAPRVRAAAQAIARRLQENPPDALIAHLWPLTVVTALGRTRTRVQTRLAVVDHNPLSLQYKGRGIAHRLLLRTSIAASYRLADARIAVSEGVADDLSILSGIDRAKFTVITNPVPPQRPVDADAETAAESLWGPRPALRIVSAGSFKAQKNQGLLIRAFAKAFPANGAQLMLLGEGMLRPQLEGLARELGVAERVIMPGFMPSPTPFYRTADLFVLSSDYEGFGNVIVEALQQGLPVVSTDCPSGPAEILQNGRYGVLVPCNDAERLAQAMKIALSQPHDRAARMRRAEDFSAPVAAQAYLKALFPDKRSALLDPRGIFK